jgi:tRNA modification GTPase
MSGHSDTIFALSSGSLPSGVAVVRISGPLAVNALLSMCGTVPPERKVTLLSISGADGDLLDRGLVLYFKGPNSFTGEDCVEFQVHGGKAVVNAILSCLGTLDGFRHASAGEFSRRAFENGKLDLVEVEGLADLIRAETEMQRRLARYMSEGQLSRRYQIWMERLSRSRAFIEAELDFADEDDVPGSVSAVVWEEVSALADELQASLDSRTGEIVRDGFRIAIAGPPNAGKSSLLNFLAKRDIAIVSSVAGTTRDVLTVDLDVDGHKVTLFDTAGLRETDDEVEQIGIDRARTVLLNADLVLYLYEGETGASGNLETLVSDAEIWCVRTKSDINGDEGALSISTANGSGIDSLMKRISGVLSEMSRGGDFDVPLLSRHRNNLEQALGALQESLSNTDQSLEFRAESLRIASEHLGRITGTVSADELLGLIFSEFCIGK